MTSLIKALALKNFKGFSNEVRIELRPITLLFGANSAGKSSVLQALQYMREILERHNANADRTLQGGDAVDLGGFLNLVHGRDEQRHIEIDVEMQLGSMSIPELVPDAFEDWQTSDKNVWWMYETLQAVRRKVSTVGVRLTVGWSEQRELPIVLGYQVSTNEDWCLRISASEDGRDAHMQINHGNPIFLVDVAEDEVLLEELEDFVSSTDLGETVNTGPQGPDSRQVPASMRSVLQDVLFTVQDAGMARPGDGLRAWLSGFRGAMPRLDQMLYIPAPGARGAENVYMVREFTAFLSWLTIGPALLLREQLRQLRYVGPLRCIPSRDFGVSLTKNEAAWSDGMAAWEALLTGSQDLVERVSDWMRSPSKLSTGYSVARGLVQESDISLAVPKAVGPIRKRAQLVDAAGLTHQPQDVGVGIAQVLPVVVAAQDGGASLVCIEQPELHIHPAVQVRLGDLFIDGALNQDLSFLIETHSEHLILRLLRRIREATESAADGTESSVKPDLVSVYYLAKEDGHVVASAIPVRADGDFDKPWPRGFFEERGPELF